MTHKDKIYDIGVVIGRFQPVHNSHIKIFLMALEQSHKLKIIIGSANEPRTIKNPFTFKERAEMIMYSLYDAGVDDVANRVSIVPIENSAYNNQEWASNVHDIVDNFAGKKDARIGLFGHMKDASSFYLDMFPKWNFEEVGNIDGLHSTSIRDFLFNKFCDRVFQSHNVPGAVKEFLGLFIKTPAFDILVDEYRFIREYKMGWETAPYTPTFVTADALVIQSGHVLLVTRRASPGKGLWAMPGGFVNPKEYIEVAMLRELKEETKLKVPAPVLRGNIVDTRVFDKPDRSLRGRTITHVYKIDLGTGELPKVKGGDDAVKAMWVPLQEVLKSKHRFFEDHHDIIKSMM